MSELDDRRGVALALGQLADIGSARLRGLLAAGAPSVVWSAVRAGEPPIAGVDRSVAARWAVAARDLDPEVELRRHLGAGLGVATIGDPGYPDRLSVDKAPPALLVWDGDLAALDGRTVGIVGTRRCTHYGRDTAFAFGSQLASLGISVVSGLALGIDGAAHAGTTSAEGAPPVAVVANGLDRIYPRRHEMLWREVARRGVVIAEVPMGVAALPWRFPARNRIIAALSELLVVVESSPKGGSMHTVRQADDRGRTVMAVPGPIRSEASEGTNLLISEGCPPCCGVPDIAVALGLATASAPTSTRAAGTVLGHAARRVLEALDRTPTSLEQLVVRSGLGIGETNAALLELEDAGCVSAANGWFERRDLC